ncbi:MAG: hypothetical protein NC489_36465 [Ruminococcus flavefaciens]|nr:hypothetical protein [Ruminococcus flavefaciens]
MKREHIEQMLSHIDKNYIKETIDAAQKIESKKKSFHQIRKYAAAAAVCLIILGTGISVTAATSDVFRNWLTKIFNGHQITRVEIEPVETPTKDIAADLPTDQNSHLTLAENTEICGETESFVCQYHMDDEEMIMDKIYSIENNGLKKMPLQRFHGKYDGVDFSFEYAIINHEIFGCNLTGDISKVFHYTDGETIYAELCELTDEVFTKGCIAKLNLNTGTVEKLTNDKTIGNMMMSPSGKVILINYRMDGYWTVFDIASRTEKEIKEINGYARTDEVIFQDDYHVLTYGDSYYTTPDAVTTGTKIIDLKTGQRTASYKKCGEYEPQWIYRHKKDRLTIQHVDGTTAIQIDNIQGTPYPLSSRGDYVLLGNSEEKNMPYYLCDLREKTYMTITPPARLKENVEIYLAAKEGKALLTDGKEAYLVNIRN